MEHNWHKKVVYTIIPSIAVSDNVLEQCAVLFSEHYGTWSDKNEHKQFVPVAGASVKYSATKLKSEYMFNDRCGLVTASVDNIIIGHAFFTTFEVQREEIGVHFTAEKPNVRWVTQLVVHSDYRHHKVAQYLLLHSLGTKSQIYGLVTSHPYAIKALERATRSKCLNLGSEKVKYVLEKSQIPYLKLDNVQVKCDESQSLINTNFYVNHAEVEKVLRSVVEQSQKLDDIFEDSHVGDVIRENMLKRELLITQELKDLEPFKNKNAEVRRATLHKESRFATDNLNFFGHEKLEIVPEPQFSALFQEYYPWILGNTLPDGHEFVAIAFSPLIIPTTNSRGGGAKFPSNLANLV